MLLHAKVHQQTASKRVPIAILLVSDLVPNLHSESMLSRAILDLSGLIFASSQISESEVTQSCPTLCDPVDCSPPGSSVHGILQARVLEWVAISFSRGLFPTQG